METTIFDGDFLFFLGHGDYADRDQASWKLVPVPAILATQGAARALRASTGSESAQVFTHDGSHHDGSPLGTVGVRVTWGIHTEYVSGRCSNFHEMSPLDARGSVAAKLVDPTVRSVRVERMEGGIRAATWYARG